MKKASVIGLFLAFIASSCSTDVDIYNDYKDTTIVYAVLDAANDTNVIKIVRAYAGSNNGSFDAHQSAMVTDSSSYPGKLDVRFIEYEQSLSSNYSPTGRQIILDTLTLHNKPEGQFYHPDQKVYYTKEPFRVNNRFNKYKYCLSINKPNDTIRSEVSLLGGNNFEIVTKLVYFKAHNGSTNKLFFHPDDNDALYQLTMRFNYTELRDGQDTIRKSVSWAIGPYSPCDLGYENGNLYFTYFESSLFSALENAIRNDTLNVERLFDSFELTIYAYGKELEDYRQVSTASSAIDYIYTNIQGGYGILSSSHRIKEEAQLSSLSQTDLLSMPWGFKHIGYK